MKGILIFGGFICLHLNSFAAIRYVKEGGSGTQTGVSWADASGDLQQMINASSATTLDTIYVAAGTYLPNVCKRY